MKELALNILDLLENSAAAKAENIMLIIYENTDKIHIELKDDGSGIDGNPNRLLDPFYSSKNKKIGLGLPFVKEIVTLCQGSMDIQGKPGSGTNISFNLPKGCIDLPPLGNIVSTIITFITLHPEINFKYEHVIGEKFSIFDSQEFKTMLEDVPINHPKVLKLLESYLENNLKNLYGGN
ncbi:MAG: Globin-coupled histidine kinase [candidate division WS2 bacterium]|uniref:histidine kinase n=1 Tax=Psychracetigena formicireducens TaxID=2986056 RepID=A0A9E2BFN9_PSYF1|nr:Globin-coupled histidine kinase [Candidatus Psychracetigena formicireducens]MBT9144751.1 Globin-coupled histidine kinase [Candidatus Psychracetigena formicireducens]MBT9150218.1 Globin-coupled histidine kinase [Candidatus Psychracetigena formicireducens]